MDKDGKAFPVFSLPAGTNPNLAGATVNHAYVLLNIGAGVTVDYVSSAEACDLVP